MELSNPCDLNRRQFLETGFTGLVSAIVASQMNIPVFGTQDTGGKKKIKNCILLWMAGGPSQLDTFDPKPGKDTGGPFKDIKTSVTGVHISEHLPLLASQAKHLAIIRSVTSREGDHARASYFVHTGYAPQPAVQHPGIGSIIVSRVAKDDFDLPNYVSIGGAATGSGFLGERYNPFIVQNPNQTPENLHPRGAFSEKRLDEKLLLLEDIEKEFAKSRGAAESQAHQEMYKKASRMIKSQLTKAFDVSLENDSVRKSYGRHNFGQGCLLARRLVEAGVRFVEVTLGGWDTHDDNFDKTKNLMGILDPAYSTLINDLNERGLLEETLVIWMGEFGRTPRINERNGRDHYPKAWTIVLAGGGVLGGQTVGVTDDKGIEVKDKPVVIKDLFATILNSFGIDHTQKNITPQGRPITLVDKDAKLVKGLFKHV